MVDIADGLLYYLVFLFSTTLHEAAHAWAASRGGDLTAYHGGQVSLNPIPHIRREPIGMVVLPLIFVATTGWPFGYASAPYDRQWASRYPRRAAWMALAGPAANFILVIVAMLLIRIGILAGLVYSPHTVHFGEIAGTDAGGLWPGTIHLIGIFFSLNLLLGAFNLLPLPPLDGSGAVPLLLSPSATRKYQDFIWGTPAIGLFGILIAWKLFDVLFDPIFSLSLALLYPGTSYR